jgi:hypothetical protein
VSCNVEGKCEIHLLDPIFKNPCSFSAVSEVFDEILDKHLGDREWLALGCDGLPYILDLKLSKTTSSVQFVKCPLIQKRNL